MMSSQESPKVESQAVKEPKKWSQSEIESTYFKLAAKLGDVNFKMHILELERNQITAQLMMLNKIAGESAAAAAEQNVEKTTTP